MSAEAALMNPYPLASELSLGIRNKDWSSLFLTLLVPVLS